MALPCQLSPKIGLNEQFMLLAATEPFMDESDSHLAGFILFTLRRGKYLPGDLIYTYKNKKPFYFMQK